jgi:hypothetical protein
MKKCRNCTWYDDTDQRCAFPQPMTIQDNMEGWSFCSNVAPERDASDCKCFDLRLTGRVWAYGDFGCCPPNKLATTREVLVDHLGYDSETIEPVAVHGPAIEPTPPPARVVLHRDGAGDIRGVYALGAEPPRHNGLLNREVHLVVLSKDGE